MYIDFIETKLDSVEGWLVKDAAYFSYFLIKEQEKFTDGSILEIGVYAGKYLSLLYEASQGTNDEVLGVDIFSGVSEQVVSDNIKTICGDNDRLKLLKKDSTLLSRDEILNALGRQPRFISVDGLHTPNGVYSDLKLSESIIADFGVIAVDDLLNPLAIGVSNGFYKYFIEEKSELTPLVYTANKIFLCKNKHKEHYERIIDNFISKYEFLSTVKDFNKRKNRGLDWIKQEILSSYVYIL